MALNATTTRSRHHQYAPSINKSIVCACLCVWANQLPRPQIWGQLHTGPPVKKRRPSLPLLLLLRSHCCCDCREGCLLPLPAPEGQWGITFRSAWRGGRQGGPWSLLQQRALVRLRRAWVPQQRA
jgi:hypothetical protein